MDTKGREELLGMQSCQSYQGCPVCLHTWTPGKILGRTQVVCDDTGVFYPGIRQPGRRLLLLKDKLMSTGPFCLAVDVVNY